MDAQMILTTVPLAEIMEQMRVIVREELQNQNKSELAEKLLNSKEAAALLRITLVTLWQWEKDNRIVKYTLGGRAYFKYSELMASLKDLRKYGR